MGKKKKCCEKYKKKGKKACKSCPRKHKLSGEFAPCPLPAMMIDYLGSQEGHPVATDPWR
jgi:hypothetical protein